MKQTLLLFMFVLGMLSNNVSAQTKKPIRTANRQTQTSSVEKSRKMGIDGKTWYLTKKNNLFGAQDETGKEILPIAFSSIYYRCDEKSGIRYFYAEQNGYASIWSIMGKCIIPSSKKYNYIGLETRNDKMCWAIKTNGKYGIIDTKEEMVVPPRYYNVRLTNFLSSDPVYIQIWDENMKHQGICDLNGNILYEPIYNSCYIKKYDGLGTYVCKNGKDEKLSSYSEDSRFNYHFIEDIKGEPFERLYYDSYIINGKTYYSKRENGCFKVFNENNQIIVPLSRGYDAIWAFCDDNGSCRCFKVRKEGVYGIVNSQGVEITSPEFQEIEYAGANLVKFKINDSWGIMRFDGKIVVPSSRGYTSIGKYLKSQKTFPYTMPGYKGEFDINGRQISKIKVDTPQQAVASNSSSNSSSSSSSASSSSSSSNNNSGSGTTQTVVVEHHRDPVPIQEWQQCVACFGSGQCPNVQCGGSGWYYIGDRATTCSRCHGSGKCTICAGKGGQYVTVYR